MTQKIKHGPFIFSNEKTGEQSALVTKFEIDRINGLLEMLAEKIRPEMLIEGTPIEVCDVADEYHLAYAVDISGTGITVANYARVRYLDCVELTERYTVDYWRYIGETEWKK